MDVQGTRVYFDDEADIINLKSLEYYLSKEGNLYFSYPGAPAALNGVPGYIASVNKSWKIVENADKTITVTPSILVKGDQHLPAWHGYLTNGIWKTC